MNGSIKVAMLGLLPTAHPTAVKSSMSMLIFFILIKEIS